MPTPTPKPAPPPAAKPAPAPVAEPAPAPLPDDWAIYYRLTVDERFSSQQMIEAVASNLTGTEVRTGPLIVQPEAGALESSMVVLDRIIRGHIAAVRQPAEPQPLQIQQPAPIQAAPPVAPAPAAAEPSPDGPATPEQIAQVQSAIAALNDEWQTYVLECFRIEFNFPADQKLSTRIKSVRHVEFILGMLPS